MQTQFDYPEQIGKYRIVKHLSRGSYGNALLAKDQEDNEVVIKLLRPDHAPGGRERYENEVWALENLEYHNIPKLIDKGTYNNYPYIVMQKAIGETLGTIVSRNKREGGVVSQLDALTIIDGILDSLAYSHSKNILHRDIKDENVIFDRSTSTVWLIDFGFCKGDTPVKVNDSFWNVGAGRFSPPSKLNHPSESKQNHDVFAVGVLGYLLLTNEYPWSVAKQEDRGHLLSAMKTVIPEPIHILNRFVNKKVSEFIRKLMIIDDDFRPSAYEALNEIRKIKNEIENKKLAHKLKLKYSRVIRDPLHGDIQMSEFEWKIISTKEFQRLRWMRQLGLSCLVYPGAEHSRFSHSIGTAHVATIILDRVANITGIPFDQEEIMIARAYALLHDVVHICFGHTFEDELCIFKRHDKNEERFRRLISDSSDINKILKSYDFGEDLISYLNPSFDRNNWICELIESPIGADVIDYINRDSFYCGLDHRVDSAIFRRYMIGSKPEEPLQRHHLLTRLYGEHGFRLDAEFSLSSLLQERYALFLKVYTHPAKSAAGAMIGKSVFAAISEQEPKLDENLIEWMGDNQLVTFLKNHDNEISAKLAKFIEQRKLFKPTFKSGIAEKDDTISSHKIQIRTERLKEKGLFDPKKRNELENSIAKDAKIEPTDIILYCPPNAPGLQTLNNYVETKPGQTYFRDDAHKTHDMFFKLHVGLWNIYAFVNPELNPDKKTKVGKIVSEALGMSNVISDKYQLENY